ncbi:MAG: NlpC/P60 family protein [Chitinophagaceae bacterium]
MRCISIVLLALTLGSCTALKPVINNKSSSSNSHRENQPRFIENISITPLAAAPAVKPSVHSNNTFRNTFSMEGNSPVIYTPMQFKFAILMGVPVEALNNLKLFSFIDEWYGVPYHFGGSSKSGVDCSAFSGNLMTSVFGVGLPRMAKDQYSACERVQKNDLEEGDLVFFHTTRKGISHVGVYLGNNKFVHASLNYGVTISDLTDPYYTRTFRSGGRIRQNETISASGN